MDFKSYYRELFDTFGYPLSPSEGIPVTTLTTAANALGHTIPRSLLDYYAVAGNEKQFNNAFQQLLSPAEWERDGDKLIFMAENQGVVLWSIDVSDSENPDPPVFQSANKSSFHWHQEHSQCSVFLAVMLHYQAVSGGREFSASSALPQNLKDLLVAGWKCHGTVNNLTAYSRPGQILCAEPTLGLLVAGKTEADLQMIQSDLGLTIS